MDEKPILATDVHRRIAAFLDQEPAVYDTDDTSVISSLADQLAEHPDSRTWKRCICDFADQIDEEQLLPFERAINLLGGSIIKHENVWPNADPMLGAIQEYFAAKHEHHGMWSGRPEFLNDEILSCLQNEAREMRKSAFKRNNAMVAAPGDVASQIVLSDWISAKVEELYPSYSCSGFGTYLFYEEPGDGVRPHVDVGQFAVNVMIGVDHCGPPRSSTWLYEPFQPVKKIMLRPGEIVVFPAGAWFHWRTPLIEDEMVTVFTSGFRR